MIDNADRNAKQADAMAELFQAIAAAGDHYEEDYKVEAKTYNDCKYYVLLGVKGKSIALEPDWARRFADEIYAAADEAEQAEVQTTDNQQGITKERGNR